MTILEVTNLKKIYTTRLGLNQVQALTNVSFTVEEGEYVAIMGESGSGKTTLLNCILDDLKSSGKILFLGEKMQYSSLQQRKQIGIVPDDTLLLDYLTMEENGFILIKK